MSTEEKPSRKVLIANLTEADKGREVCYKSSHGDKIEYGRITS